MDPCLMMPPVFALYLLEASCMISDAKNKIRKNANRILAMPTAAPAMPANPSTPAISAMIKNVMVQPSILFPFSLHWLFRDSTVEL